MKLFSQRKGLKPIKSILQVDSVDRDLLNGLWNALSLHYWCNLRSVPHEAKGRRAQSNVKALCNLLWLDYFKLPIDTLSKYEEEIYKYLRDYFFKCTWYEVYDFIQFVANAFPSAYPNANTNRDFMNYCNELLERELSAYRFVGDEITQITSEEEIAEIEEALSVKVDPVIEHLKSALKLLSDKKSPDYRNSIKESISAVEALCGLITKNPKATLGDALKEIEKHIKLHGALKKAFSNLYGYTSDADGIRHALMDIPNLGFEDAKFMLVSCSAFINFLIEKSSKAGIKF